MGKNAYERRRIREARAAASPPVVQPVEWHEQNVLKKARKFAQVFVTTVGFGAPVAKAGWALNEAVERLEAAEHREREAKREAKRALRALQPAERGVP